MFDFFRSLFKPVPPSGETAKERLKLVLLSDHLSLAPEVVESLKRDLMEVISRYVEIDSAHADVTFEHREREIAMLASIPITGVRARETPKSTVFPTPPPAPRAEPSFKNDHLVFESGQQQAPKPHMNASAAVAESAPVSEIPDPHLSIEPETTPAANDAATRHYDEPVTTSPTLDLATAGVEPAAKPKPSASPAATQTPLRASNAAQPRRRRRKKLTAAAAKRAAQASPLGNQASAQG